MNFKEGDLVHSDLFGKGVVTFVSQRENKIYTICVAFEDTYAYFNSQGKYFNGLESLADIILIPPIPTSSDVEYH